MSFPSDPNLVHEAASGTAKSWPTIPAPEPYLRTRAEIMLDPLEHLPKDRNIDTEAAAWALLACSSRDGRAAAANAVSLGIPPEFLAVCAIRSDAPTVLEAAISLGADPLDIPCTIASNSRVPMWQACSTETAVNCLTLLAQSFPESVRPALSIAASDRRQLCVSALLPFADHDAATSALLSTSRFAHRQLHSREDAQIPWLVKALLSAGADPTALDFDGLSACHHLVSSFCRAEAERQRPDLVFQALSEIPSWWSPASSGRSPLLLATETPAFGSAPPSTFWSRGEAAPTPVGLVLFSSAFSSDPTLLLDSELIDSAILASFRSTAGPAVSEFLCSQGARITPAAAAQILSLCVPSDASDLWRAKSRLLPLSLAAKMAPESFVQHFDSLIVKLSSATSGAAWTKASCSEWEALAIQLHTSDIEAAPVQPSRIRRI